MSRRPARKRNALSAKQESQRRTNVLPWIRKTHEERSATSSARAALYVAQGQLELARLAYREEDPTSPICIRARELSHALGALVEQIQRVGEPREERSAR